MTSATILTTADRDPRDRRLALSATGLLRIFNEGDVLSAADVHVASRLGTILGEQSETVLLAAALAVRAVRHGSICLDLETIAALAVEAPVAGDEPATPEQSLPWPEVAPWLAEVAASRLVGEEVFRVEGSSLYLDRYWREEGQVCTDLLDRMARPAPELDSAMLVAGIDRVFPDEGYDEQRAAVLTSAGRWTTILTGGPGTGKTTAVAGLLTLIAEQHEAASGQPPRIALCAPTGKASARLQEAVAEAAGTLTAPADRARVAGLQSSTLHRLLGWRPDSSVRFKHHRSNRLPHDVIVVDETSMVSLTMMARLLEAVRPDARLVLVGDPDQLSSVEAGAVLADLVAGLASRPDSPVVSLRTTHRYGANIGAMAAALRAEDADAVIEVLRSGSADVEFIDPDDEPAMAAFTASVVDVAEDLRVCAEAGDGPGALQALAGHRLLCAHREGPYGVSGWNRLVEQLLSERTGVTSYDDWYPGRPILVTANDKGQRLSNGDMGVAVRRDEGRLRVVLAELEGREFAPTRLPDVQTVHAMTVHKSQGSQADTVSVIVPPEGSRLLTRELLYTAVTRAQRQLRVIGTEESIRAAVARKVQRASGLARRLQG
ncbi:MAG: exodeoxyribonuclease V subunit alpha [Marmoricola sp.]